MKSKLLVYSGGMDSTCLLFENQKDIATAITFDYGSKHNDREFSYAQFNCDFLGIDLLRVDLKSFFQYFESDLLKSGGAIPEGHYEHESMKKTVVPFRNGIMLTIAAGIAESRKLNTVLIANHFGDHAIYPDCRESFITPMKQAVLNGTENNVLIEAPYTSKTKKQIAEIGKKYGVKFEQTYSCYNGGVNHCGVCGTCVERKEALGKEDPTIYDK